jgi:hypothetical protein
MYIKLKNGVIDKYPYSLADLVKDNPDTSFPAEISDACAAGFEVYPVILVDKPQVDHTQTVIEETPSLINGSWFQDFSVVDATVEEIAARVQQLNAIADSSRAEAYRNESDPIYFKWQRGEALYEDWLDKVDEIRARYPKVT